MVDLLIDPDDLAQATEVTLNKTLFTFDLNDSGNLASKKVTGRCWYSWLSRLSGARSACRIILTSLIQSTHKRAL